MTGADATALLPFILLGATPVAAMLAIAVRRDRAAVLGVTLVGLAASFAALWPAARVAPRQVTPLLAVDGFALFYAGLIVATTFAVSLLAQGYLDRRTVPPEELYVLVTLAAAGAAVLAAATHFASLFLGLEILSVSLYALLAYLPDRRLPLEAGVKYLVLAASSAAFLLFGMALVYAALGTMSFQGIAAGIAAARPSDRALVVPGVVLLVTGIGFKLALVPFHLWTPDVYEGSPAPVTAFIATASKGAMFALLLRFFFRTGSFDLGAVSLVFSVLAVASMALGNLLALLERNVKRILAYSSIAHMGYLVVAFLSGGALATQAATFYLVAYFVTTLICFGVVTVLSGRERDADSLEDYRGLFWRRPALGAIFTAGLLSLAGIPLTAGFVGKFYVVAAGASAEIWTLVLVLVVTSVVGLFYYLRIVLALYSRAPAQAERGVAEVAAPLATGARAVLAGLTILLLWFGIYPANILRLIRSAVGAVL